VPGEVWKKPSEEWQELIVKLLPLKFGLGNFVEIPDTVNGDCGLEGFTRCGKAFQCYAAVEPLSTAELTKKQKVKISSDVPKLARNRDILAGILGPTILNKWMFIVPRWEDKSLLAHAETKMAELRAQNLPFIAPDIVPSICTGEEFATERQQLIRAGREELRVDVPLVHSSQVSDWAAQNDPLVSQLFRKVLAIRHGDSTTALQLRDLYVKHYLDGQNTIAKLRKDYPEMFEAVDRIKKDKEHFLETESLVTSSLPPDHLKQTVSALESEIQAAMQGLNSFTVKQLVQEAVADWLLRCPLDFPNSQQNGPTH
jgi:hypothetical protein